MSRQNKVNPGKYTQAGRLTPDDTARELKKQREMASPRNAEGGQLGEKAKSRRVTQKDKASEDENDE
jgi:hypothetical protein